MSDPATYEEYLARFNQNQKIEGEGMDTTIHACCPFCCAPDFQTYRVLDVKEEVVKASTCEECGRSAKVVLTEVEDGKGTQLELVQLGGDPPPPYLPVIRRAREASNDE